MAGSGDGIASLQRDRVPTIAFSSARMVAPKPHLGLQLSTGHDPIPRGGAPTMAPKTLFEKIWDSHVVHQEPGKPAILYIDCHLVHEVTSPQAFEGLRITGRKVRRPDLTFATMDHNVPTTSRSLPIADLISKTQIDTLEHN